MIGTLISFVKSKWSVYGLLFLIIAGLGFTTVYYRGKFETQKEKNRTCSAYLETQNAGIAEMRRKAAEALITQKRLQKEIDLEKESSYKKIDRLTRAEPPLDCLAAIQWGAIQIHEWN